MAVCQPFRLSARLFSTLRCCPSAQAHVQAQARSLLGFRPSYSAMRLTRQLSDGGQDLVRVEPLGDDGQVRLLIMNKGPANALNREMLIALNTALKRLEKDEDCEAVVITSSLGKIFSGGLDIMEMYKATRESATEFWTALQDFWLTLYLSPLVTVAAINGASPAGGCLIASSCDRRLMVEGKYSIGLNETKLGIVAPSWFKDTFVNLVGQRVAERALLLGTLFSAEQALSVGLIDEIVPASELRERALEEAEQYLQVPGMARTLTKRQLRQDTAARLINNREKDVKLFVDLVMTDQVQNALEMYVAMLRARKG